MKVQRNVTLRYTDAKQQFANHRSEAKFILDNLVSSSEIYGHYRHAVAGEPTGYANGFEREEQMKHLFMRQ